MSLPSWLRPFAVRLLSRTRSHRRSRRRQPGLEPLEQRLAPALNALPANLDQNLALLTTQARISTPESAETIDRIHELVQFDASDRPIVNIWATGSSASIAGQVRNLGGDVLATSDEFNLLEVSIDVAHLPTLAQLPGVVSVTPVYRPFANTGAVTTQGDAVMNADDLRNTTLFPPSGFTGSGVKVGVLSDSVNRAGGGLPSSRNTGDLPANVEIVSDGILGPWGDTDEGRAMLEIVHDVAPGASLAFATASGGELAFARGIRELAEAGADIIVDDIRYFTEPFFQDGIVARAVDDVVRQWGVTYFSSAGNYGSVSYEAGFVDSGTSGLHDFDPGAGIDTMQMLTLPAVPSGYRRTFTLVMQWDQAFYTTDGVTSDYDVLLYADNGTSVIASATSNNLATQQPMEILQWRQYSSSDTTPNLAIRKNTGAAGQMKYILFASDAQISEYATNSGTVTGHAAAAGAIAVGAVPYHTPGSIESFSSLGPTTIYFDAAGQRLATPEVRQKPELVAPDNVNTTFFGTDIPEDADSHPNFAGTSASAPHAAAAAALLKSVNPTLSPEQMRQILTSSAIDLGEVGWDRVFGHGRIDVLAAQPLAAAASDTQAPLASLIRPSSELFVPVSKLQVAFSEDVTPATASDVTQYDLRAPGADDLFDTADDVVYTLTVVYHAGNHSADLTFTQPNSILPPDTYRLTVEAGIVDTSNNVLNGGTNQTFTFTTPLFGSEFLIRDYGTTPTAGIADDGHSLVAWDQSSFIFGQFLGTDGHPIHSDLFVDINADTYDHTPEIDMLPDGRFVATYDAYYGGGDWDAAVAIYAADGRLVRDVGYYATTVDRNTDAAIAQTGNVVLVWDTREYGSGTTTDVYARLYDPAGNLLRTLFPINTTTAGNQSNAQVGMDAQGNFVVVWQSQNQDGSGSGLYGRRFDSTGEALGGEFLVHSTTTGDQTDASLDVMPDGRFVVAFQGVGADGRKHVYVRLFDAAGNPVATEFAASTRGEIEQTNPSVAFDGAGNFVVVWQSVGLVDASYADIFACRFTAQGQPIGAEFLVNHLVHSNLQQHPRVAVNSTGRILVTWSHQVGYTNSIRGRFLEMGQLPVADLSVDTVSAPTLYVAGEPLTVSATISNTGPVAAGAFTARYYLSRDRLITADDEAISEAFVIDGLEPLQATTDSRTIAPRAGLTGSYYIGLLVDGDNAVIEFDELALNQRAAAAVTTFTLEPPPNLQVTLVDAPATAGSSLPVTITWTVTNTGTGPTGTSWTDRVYISSDTTLDASDVLLGSVVHTGALTPNQNYQTSLTGTVPNGYSGTYHVLVKTDALNQVDEVTSPAENDNVGQDSLSIALTPPPDLQVTSVNAPATGTAGRTISLSWTVTNTGSGDTLGSDWLDRIYLSTDTTLDVNTDIRVAGQQHSGALAAGASYTRTETITLPETVSGNYHVFVLTDATEQIYEHTSESNNSALDTGAIAIAAAPPDLVVTSVDAPSSGVAGQDVTVTWTVRNDGLNATTATVWSDRVYVSADATLDPNTDRLVYTRQHTGALDVNASYNVSQVVQLPLNLSGNYYVFVRTDSAGQVYEGTTGGESNNDAHDTTPVGVSIVRQTAPASEDFEDADLAALGQAWSFFDNDGKDVVKLTSTGGSHGGNQHLVMQPGSSSRSEQSAVWAVNLAGQTGATLDFWVKNLNSPTGLETDAATNYVIIIYVYYYGGGGGGSPASGKVEISQDARTWHSLTTVSPQAAYTHYNLNLDAAIAQHSLNANDTLYLRFSHTGSESQGAYAWDDVRLLTSGADLFGPRVTGHSPDTGVAGPLSSFQVTFDENVDATTFTPADVTLKDPAGRSVPVSSVTTTDNRTFTVNFPTQGVAGQYSFAIGPNVTDASASANAMNQDGDAINGEASGDAFTGSLTILSTPVTTYPFSENFDAGEVSALGSYWSFNVTGSGRIQTTTQNGPHSGTRHLLFDSTDPGQTSTETATLLLDLAGRTGVTLDFWLHGFTYTGDYGEVLMSQDGVTWHRLEFLSGTNAYEHHTYNLDAAIAAAGISYDDRFFLRFYHSGRDGAFALDDVRVLASGQDLFGPRVASQNATQALTGPVSSFEVTFNEAIDPTTFTIADVTIEDPVGRPITPTSVTTTDNRTFRINFAARTLPGLYTFAIGPNLTDASAHANPMNQDGDPVGGEASDGYLGSFTIASSPVTTYPFAEGFEVADVADLGGSWSFTTTGDGRIRTSTDEGPHGGSRHLLMDSTQGYATQTATLLLDLAGRTGVTLDYWVRRTASSGGSGQVLMSKDGNTWYSLEYVAAGAGYVHHTIDLDAAISKAGISYDESFFVRFTHTGYGYDGAFAWDDVRIRVDGADLFGPKIVNHAPTGTVTGPVANFTVTLADYRNQNTIDAASFGPNDVTILGPGGNTITASSVEDTGDHLTFRIHFPSQGLPGTYRFTIGPNVLDQAGNPLNQDGDPLNGESSDTYSGSFEVAASPATPPLVEGFEAGSLGGLGAYWAFSRDGGTLGVATSNAHGGSYALEANSTSNYTYTYQDAILHANLAGLTGVSLDFWVKEINGNDTSGSVAVSVDGSTYRTVADIAGSSVWQHYAVNLDALGLTYTTDVRIRFRHNNYYSGGFAWDDVRIVQNTDVFGPSIVSQSLSGQVTGPVSSFQVTFDEAIDAASFTSSDVTVTGPAGNLIALSGNPVDSGDRKTFTITLSTAQSLAGRYNFSVGPNVLDTAGNVMNQNRDALQGDGYAGSFDVAATPASPEVAAGFEAGSLGGLGAYWSFVRTGGTIAVTSSNPRAGSYALETYDANSYTSAYRDAILHVDLAGRTGVTLDFWVKEYTGDTYGSVAISTDGTNFTPVTTTISGSSSYQHYAINLDALGLTYTTDTQIRFRHNSSYGGGFAWDDVRVAVGRDVFGPKVTSQSLNGQVTGPVSSFQVTFDEAIDAASFTSSDVTVTGPAGNLIALSGNPVDSGDRKTFTITLSTAQSLAGRYNFSVGPNVLDTAGNVMNQDGNTLQGDGYTGSFDVAATPGTPTLNETFEAGSIGGLGAYWAFSRTVGTIEVVNSDARSGSYALRTNEANSIYSSSAVQDAILHVDLAGRSNLTLDFWVKEINGSSTSGEVAISTNGTTFTSILTISGSSSYERFSIDLDALGLTFTSDTQIRFRHSNYYSGGFVWDDIRVGQNLDVFGPRVTASTPSGNVSGAVSSLSVKFNEEIDAASFTASDVTVTGPVGNVVGISGNPVDSGDHKTFTINLASAQGLAGRYTVTVGPNVLDAAGNVMNQDGNALQGDGYTSAFDIAATPATPTLTDGFEAGSIGGLGAHWGFSRTVGTIEVVNSDVRSGSYALRTNEASSVYSSSAVQDAILHVNLAGRSNLTLDFWVKEINGTSTSGEVAISTNGTTFTSILTISGSSNYERFSIDLDALGLTFTSNTQIRFRHSNYYAGGFVWDDIRVGQNLDVFGPRVTAQSLTGTVSGPVSSLSVKFNEEIDAASFTASDVTVTGPVGNVVGISGNPVDSGDHKTFTIDLASAQGLAGRYVLTVGPNVLDTAGNVMNQDGNALQGDGYTSAFDIAATPATPTLTDGFEAGSIGGLGAHWGFSRTVGTIEVVNSDARSGSYALRTNHTLDTYSSASLQDAILHVNLAGRSNLTLDFWVKEVNGGSSSGDVAISTNGTTFTTLVSISGNSNYERYSIDLDALGLTFTSDTQIRFRHSNYYAGGFVWDDIRVGQNLDVFGPRVTAQSLTGTVSGPVSSLSVTFNEEIDAASFTASDVTVTGPVGNVVGISGNPVDSGDHKTFTIDLASAQGLAGRYTVTVGPNVLDTAGNVMNQDGNALQGDGYTSAFDIAATPATPTLTDGFEAGSIGGLGAHWGFSRTVGTIEVVNSDVRSGSYALRTNHTLDTYSSASLQDAILHVNLEGRSNLTLDFWVKEINGSYTTGDVAISTNGTTFTSILTISGSSSYERFSINLDALGIPFTSDTQIRFRHSNYYSGGFVWDDIRVGQNLDVFGPRVTAQSLTGTVSGPVSSLSVTFNEEIDAASFTASDVTVTGPVGNVVGISGNPVDSGDHKTFTIDLASAQGLAGRYTVTVGPNVLDAAGNVMNQDGNALQGDSYTGSFDIAATPATPTLTDGFEAGSIGGLGAYWGFSRTSGSIDVTTSNAHSGSYALTTSDTNNNYTSSAVQEAVLHLNLAGRTGMVLDFWVKEINGASTSGDVTISTNGTTFTTVVTISGSSSYEHFSIDLDALGLTYSSDTQIRFRHTNYYSGGFVWDDIQVGALPLSRLRVAALSPSTQVAAPIDSLTVTFGAPITASTFTAADVSIIGPAGQVVALAGDPLDSGDHQTFTLSLASAQSLAGTYTVRIGPDVSDANGNLMNQDQDVLVGETNGQDGFTGTFSVGPTTAQSIPYAQDLEGGTLSLAGWSYAVTSGTIEVTASDNPYMGGSHFRMGNGTPNVHTNREAVLKLDLSNHATASNLVFDFWVQKLGSNTASNIARFFVSGDGITYYQVGSDLNPPTLGQYKHYVFDLDQELSNKGINQDADVYVKLFHNGYYSGSVMTFDNVRVYTASTLNDAPTLTTITTLTGGTEDTAYTITHADLASAANESDPDNDPLTFRIESVNGTLTRSGVAVTPGVTLFGPGETLVWTPPANAAGTGVTAFTVRAWDGDLASAPAVAVKVDLTAVNDAPVLDDSGSPVVTSITEDTSGGSGSTVTSIIGASITDPDSSALKGIAVVAVDDTNGTWQFSTNGGSTWTSFGAASESAARLLRDTDRIRFQPTANFNGTATIRYRAWDRTVGTQGNSVDLTGSGATGGSTAYSTVFDTASITVTPVNDAPVLDSAGTMTFDTINEDEPGNGMVVSALVASAGGDRITDIDAGAVEGIAVTAVVNTNGTWEFSINGGSTWAAFGSPAGSSARLLAADARIRFVPTANWSGTVTGGITFRAWDQSTGTNGGTASTSSNGGITAFSLGSETASITVTAVNDSPVLDASGNPTLFGMVEDVAPGNAPALFAEKEANDNGTSGAQAGDLTVANDWTTSFYSIGGNDYRAVVTGNISAGSDGDWDFFKVYAEPGDTLKLELDGITLSDTYLYLYSSNPTLLTSDDDSGPGSNSLITYTGFTTAGFYYVVADSYGSNTGTYRLTATLTTTRTIASSNTVASLVGNTITDGDTGAVEGIAVVGLTGTTNGTWQYHDGASWVAFPTVSESAALLLTSTDSLRFVPNANFAGTIDLTYRAWDQTTGTRGSQVDLTGVGATGGSSAFSAASETASLTVAAVNDAPVLDASGNPTLTTIAEDTTAPAGTLVGDLVSGTITDVDAGSVQGIAVTGLTGANGTWQYTLDGGSTWSAFGSPTASSARLLAVDGSTRIRFVPDANFNGTRTITFRAWDQTTGSNGGTADASSTGGATAFSSVAETASVVVTESNDAPVGGDDSLTSIAEDSGTRTIAWATLFANDDRGASNESGQTLTITSVSDPVGGTVTISGTDVLFVPLVNYHGPASFTYAFADDGTTNGSADGKASFASVTFTITEVNDAPTAAADILATIVEDAPARTISFASLLANDSRGPSNESGQTLTVASVSNPVGGTVSISGTDVIFTPAANFNGTASFHYVLEDDGTTSGASDPQTASGNVSFLVTEINDPPTATNDVLSLVAEDSTTRTVSFAALLGNDVTGPGNENGQTLTITSVSDPVGGTVSISGTSVLFTPEANFNGTARFSYTIQDDGTTGGTDDFQSATGDVSFEVTEVNDAPIPGTDVLATISEDAGVQTIPFATLLANDVRGPGNENSQTLTITSVSDPVGGTVIISGTNVRFTPDANYHGTARFDYTIADDGTTGSILDVRSATGTATFTITEVNDTPTATNDVLSALAEGVGPQTIAFANLLANDSPGPSNESAQTLTVASVGSAVGGTVSISGSNVIFTPDADFHGTASFNYTITDDGTTNGTSDPKSATGTVSFLVTDVNDAPIAGDDVLASLFEDSSTRSIPFATLLANDSRGASNESSQTLTLTEVNDPVGGSVTIVAGNVRFTPEANFNGTASFRYTIRDNGTTNGVSDPRTATGTVSFQITEVNDPPTAVHDTLSAIVEDTASRTIPFAALLANDGTGPANESGQTLTIVAVNNPVGGTVSISGTDVIFTPNADFNGTASFSYTIEDDGTTGGTSAPRTATTSASFTVTEVNDAPVVSDDVLATMVEDADPRTISFADLLANDGKGASNESGQTLTVTAVADAIGGVASIVGTNVIFTPEADYHGPAGFRYTIRDNGTTSGASDPKTASGMVSFTLSEVNDPVVAGDDVLSEVTEDSDARTIALDSLFSNDGVGPANESSQTLRLLGISDVVGGTVSIVDSDVIFTLAANFNGTARFRYTVQDDGTTAGVDDPTSRSALVSFAVTPVNDAPTFVAGASFTLTSIPRNITSFNNVGNTVASILGPTVSDADAGAVSGIAVVGVSQPSNGTWQFSLDGGATWQALGTPASTSARLLQGTDRVRFVPATNFVGFVSLSFHAWDRTAGSAGDVVDLTGKLGGAHPYSLGSESAALEVAPSLIATPEDTYSATGTAISQMLAPAFVAANPGAGVGIAVVGTDSSRGVWQFKLYGGTTWMNFGAVSPTSARLLRTFDRIRFLPGRDFNGTASITYLAWNARAGRRGGTINPATAPGAFSTATDASMIEVTPVNDRPVMNTLPVPRFGNVAANSTNPGGNTVASLIGTSISDVDVGAKQGIAVTGLGGTLTGRWEYSLDDGRTWLTFGAVTGLRARLLRTTDLIRYVPKTNFRGTVALSYKAWDQTAGVVGGIADTRYTTAYSTAVETAYLSVV